MYFTALYGNMHKHIFAHDYFITEDNADELTSMNFIFLALDSGESKRTIINKLIFNNVPFIDTGIDIQEINSMLLGTARVTECRSDNVAEVYENISFAESEKGLYQSNVQTADLNAFCALMAIIQWKRSSGFYLDNIQRRNCVYNTNDGEFK